MPFQLIRWFTSRLCFSFVVINSSILMLKLMFIYFIFILNFLNFKKCIYTLKFDHIYSLHLLPPPFPFPQPVPLLISCVFAYFCFIFLCPWCFALFLKPRLIPARIDTIRECITINIFEAYITICHIILNYI